jgi:hypothetical protein
MRHAYRYAGAFERNYERLRPGMTTYITTDGKEHELLWPIDVDGIRVSYMEKAGKKFFAVRVQYDGHDVVLACPVHIQPALHMNNRRLTPEPSIVTDDEVSTLLDDVIRDNPEQQPELALMINQINQRRRGGRLVAD